MKKVVNVHILGMSESTYKVRVILDPLEEVELNIRKEAIPRRGYTDSAHWFRSEGGKAWLLGLVIGKKVDELMKAKSEKTMLSVSVLEDRHEYRTIKVLWSDGGVEHLHSMKAEVADISTDAFNAWLPTPEGKDYVEKLVQHKREMEKEYTVTMRAFEWKHVMLRANAELKEDKGQGLRGTSKLISELEKQGVENDL